MSLDFVGPRFQTIYALLMKGFCFFIFIKLKKALLRIIYIFTVIIVHFKTGRLTKQTKLKLVYSTEILKN